MDLMKTKKFPKLEVYKSVKGNILKGIIYNTLKLLYLDAYVDGEEGRPLYSKWESRVERRAKEIFDSLDNPPDGID